MPDKSSQFIVASDNATEYSDYLVEQLEQERLEEIDNLMSRDDNRDDDLWVALGVSATLTVQDYENEPEQERDLDWVLGLAGLAAASQTQFFLDAREDTLIKPLAYRAQLMDGFELSAAELTTAGKRGVEYVSESAFRSIQAKWYNDFSFMRELDNRTLYDALREANALKSFDQHVADSMQYVSRMTNYKPNSPQFVNAVNDLIDKDSKRAIQTMNRRSVERIYTARQIDGDMSTRMAWIVEGGSNTCSECYARAGQILTYAEWESEGLPGEEVCLGGGRCRCHLHAVF